VETIGDAYMAASGHMGNTDHANKLFSMGRDMITYSSTLLYNEKDAKVMGSDHLRIRVGIHCGPTIAGVVGTKCPRCLPVNIQ
jgi:guanylate cyclase soluble subunit beta